MAADRPTVTLIVPIRNEAAHIATCLGAIRHQTYPRDLLEILVVDGRSSDETREIVERQAAADLRIRLMDNPQRAMPHGLNIGLEAARGEYVGAVIGHSALPADYVARMIDALERTGAWGVGGRIARVASTPMQRAISAATSSPIGVGDSVHNYTDAPGWVETAFPGFWRRDVFETVGPFDPAMLVNEDNELSLRIRKAGGRIWYEPSVEIDYVPRATLGALFQQYRRYALGKMRVLRKHRGGLRWRHLVPAGWIAFLAFGMLGSLMSPILAALWLSGTAVYLTVIVVASAQLGSDGATWWRTAAALMTLHAAYGIGTWEGILTWGRE